MCCTGLWVCRTVVASVGHYANEFVSACLQWYFTICPAFSVGCKSAISCRICVKRCCWSNGESLDAYELRVRASDPSCVLSRSRVKCLKRCMTFVASFSSKLWNSSDGLPLAFPCLHTWITFITANSFKVDSRPKPRGCLCNKPVTRAFSEFRAAAVWLQQQQTRKRLRYYSLLWLRGILKRPERLFVFSFDLECKQPDGSWRSQL